jgi:hypothetical protein
MSDLLHSRAVPVVALSMCGRKALATNDISSFHGLEFLINEAAAPLGGAARLR